LFKCTRLQTKFSQCFELSKGSGRTNEINGINKKEACAARKRFWRQAVLKKLMSSKAPLQKQFTRSWRHQRFWRSSEAERLKLFQMLFKWWFNHAYHQRRLEERSNDYFKRIWRLWMLILWRELKKDICTKCTTTISTTLFLCLVVQEQQLCLQRCSSRLGMDLKLLLHKTITKSGNRSLVIL